ncbi:MAG TPA: hypothetical protein VEX43_12025 [Chthoniobacterales bacterium]|nr:hypothetical protein [Chthoniobacterales bacterium]
MSTLLTPKWIYSAPGADRPSFSPDGSQIVFHVQTGKINYSLWIVDADGCDPHLLYPPAGTANPRASRPDWSWSPTISFGNNGAIWTINPDGSGAAPYYGGGVPPPPGLIYPSWCKDLGAIVAVAYRDNLSIAALYKLTLQSVEQLTVSPKPCAGRPSVNPDGTKIAFAGNWGVCSQSENQIWVVEPPNEPFQLEPGDPASVQGRSPNWSPNGDLISFESFRQDPKKQSLAIWVMNSDGTCPRQITDAGVHAEWNRQQTQIVVASGGKIGIVDYSDI